MARLFFDSVGGPDYAKAGEVFSIWYRVNNDGDEDTGPLLSTIQVFASEGGEVSLPFESALTIGPIAAHGHVDGEWSLSLPDPGGFAAYLCVDQDGPDEVTEQHSFSITAE